MSFCLPHVHIHPGQRPVATPFIRGRATRGLARWSQRRVDVTSLISGAISATLSFGLAGAADTAPSDGTDRRSNIHLSWARDGSACHLSFEYVLVPAHPAEPWGDGWVRLSDGQLIVDGTLYEDSDGRVGCRLDEHFVDHGDDPLSTPHGAGAASAFEVLLRASLHARRHRLDAAADPACFEALVYGLMQMATAMRGARQDG